MNLSPNDCELGLELSLAKWDFLEAKALGLARGIFLMVSCAFEKKLKSIFTNAIHANDKNGRTAAVVRASLKVAEYRQKLILSFFELIFIF